MRGRLHLASSTMDPFPYSNRTDFENICNTGHGHAVKGIQNNGKRFNRRIFAASGSGAEWAGACLAFVALKATCVATLQSSLTDTAYNTM